VKKRLPVCPGVGTKNPLYHMRIPALNQEQISSLNLLGMMFYLPGYQAARAKMSIIEWSKA
jgi:hypothetical protein